MLEEVALGEQLMLVLRVAQEYLGITERASLRLFKFEPVTHEHLEFSETLSERPSKRRSQYLIVVHYLR